MKKIVYLLISYIFIFVFWVNSVYGYTNTQVYLYSNKNIVKKGEEIDIILSIDNAKTASYTAYIYFDDSYFEYVTGPDISNIDNNRIIYVWYDQNGGQNPKDGNLASFKFKAKQDGTTTFNVSGEFYDEQGNLIETDFKDFEVEIGEKLIDDNTVNLQTLDSITNLENLAVENMLLYPSFDTNITNYNFEVPNDVTDLNILAVPENENAKVEMKGGSNLKEGDNLIKVTVTAENGYSQKIYNLNAYRRSQEEENVYIQEQEENKKKLEQIYQTQKTSTELETNEENNVVSQNKEMNRNNLVFIIVIAIGVILVIIIWSFYKRNKK